MKKLLFFLPLFLLLFGTAVAHAGSQGSTVVPNIQGRYSSVNSYTTTQINISNITDKDIRCTIHYYANGGNDVGDLTRVYKGSETSSESILVSEGKTFTLPAHNTYKIDFYRPTPHFRTGYVVIEWESADSKIVKPLIAGVRNIWRFHRDAYGVSFGEVNNGQPF